METPPGADGEGLCLPQILLRGLLPSSPPAPACQENMRHGGSRACLRSVGILGQALVAMSREPWKARHFHCLQRGAQWGLTPQLTQLLPEVMQLTSRSLVSHRHCYSLGGGGVGCNAFASSRWCWWHGLCSGAMSCLGRFCISG